MLVEVLQSENQAAAAQAAGALWSLCVDNDANKQVNLPCPFSVSEYKLENYCCLGNGPFSFRSAFSCPSPCGFGLAPSVEPRRL